MYEVLNLTYNIILQCSQFNIPEIEEVARLLTYKHGRDARGFYDEHEESYCGFCSEGS